MAREDILPQLIRTLMQKEGPPEESDNSILQKMIIPYDHATLSDTMTVSRVPTTTRLWGSFTWSMSQWGNVIEKMIALQDKATVSDSITITKIPNGSQTWGNFSWGMNEWYIPGNTSWQAIQNTTWANFGNTTWNSL
jgi:hypothetical protein